MASACEEQRHSGIPGLHSGDLWVPSQFAGGEKRDKMMDNFSGLECRQFHSGVQRLPSEATQGMLPESVEEEDYMAVLAERVACTMLLDEDDDENFQHDSFYFPYDPRSTGSLKDGTHFEYQVAGSPKSPLKQVGFNGISHAIHSPSLRNSRGLQDIARLSSVRSTFGLHQQPNQPTRALVREESHRPIVSTALNIPWNKNFGTRKEAFPASSLESSFAAEQNSWSTRLRPDERKIHFQVPQQFQQPSKGHPERQGRLGVQAQQVRGRQGYGKPPHRFGPTCRPAQVNGGTGMRAVFLGTNVPGRESGGTGVFLPRRLDNAYSTKQKPACSTVLLPARIVQALNLNVGNLHSTQSGLSDASQNRRVYVKTTESPMQSSVPNRLSEQRLLSNYAECSVNLPYSASDDIVLPQEWTY
eukprot:TRINITY_DN5358_c0_g1_i1.p1 TRINITY_DN5358_c0_g1~~TRINITY_DN5358_c0_g1_i1.p1  ORF type:complete len:415 (-),score=47.21 TRINITY_DN5358_c0_g1_i1:461-1705(-)